MVPDAARPPSPPRPRQHKVDLSPPALRANQPPVPVENGGVGAVALGLLGSIRFDLVLASTAPYDQARTSRRSAAERGWRAEVRFHPRGSDVGSPYLPMISRITLTIAVTMAPRAARPAVTAVHVTRLPS
jgi:hypothetical protein